MYKVRKTFKLPIGHRLAKHKGLCQNPHGHNFKFEIELKSDKLNSNDMVMDFSDLKKLVNHLIEKFDHCTLFNPTDSVNITHHMNNGYRVATLHGADTDIDPTAEVLSKWLFQEINAELLYNDASVSSVRIWENDDSLAEYCED